MKIQISNIKKYYNTNLVLNIPFLKYEENSINGIIGPNGSGKSTLMKILANLVNPTEGNVTYNNNTFSKSTAKEVTYMSHNSYLFNDTVRNNIAYPLKIRNYPRNKINLIVEELINEFELNHIANSNATKLSGGEVQKTAFARAISFNPKLLILDEPTSNIDPSFIKQIEKSLVKRKENANMTVLFVTHNTTQALRICDSITFLNKGNVIFQGFKEELLTCCNNLIKDFMEIY